MKSTPVSSSNPLGYYFNQDKAAAAMGKLQSAHSVLEKPSGQNKAALGYYFNKEQPQTAQIEQAGREGTLQPYEGDKDVAAADGGIARQGKGLSSVVQTSVYMHPGQHAANGKPRTAVAAMPHAQLQADLQVGLYAT